MFRRLPLVLSPRKAALLLALIAASGCTLNTDVSGPSAVIKYSGDQQTAPANTALQLPLTVIVVNQFGAQVKDVTVSWVITAGGGSVSAPATLTDESGLASVNYTTGPTPGQAIIQARVNGILPLSFSITIT